MAATPPPGTPGHGSGITSVRRQVDARMERDPDTDEWIMLFEVICPDCGDSGGPFAEQPPEIRAVRGPYPGPGAAREAVARHTGRAG